MARRRGVKQKLRVNNVLFAVRGEREDAHAAAELEIERVDRAADADEQIGGAEGPWDGWKDDATFEVEFGSGRIEQRGHIVEGRSQRGLDVIGCDRVFAEFLADEAFKRRRAVVEKQD